LAWLQGIVAEYDGVKRRFTIAATNVNDGTYTEFTQKNLDWHLLPNAAVASSSIPGFFPPYHWDDVGIFMDGMAVYNTNVEGAIRQCRDLVDDDSKVIVDVLICNSPDEPDELTKTGHSWNNFFRNRGLNNYYHGTDSIATSMAAHPSLQWRHILN
jgi:predicted acylesterase/phospholipase RssA